MIDIPQIPATLPLMIVFVPPEQEGSKKQPAPWVPPHTPTLHVGKPVDPFPAGSVQTVNNPADSGG